jgi:hypothetical protein
MEFRTFFFTSVRCAELAKIPRNYAVFRVAEFRIVRKILSLLLRIFQKGQEGVRFLISNKNFYPF